MVRLEPCLPPSVIVDEVTAVTRPLSRARRMSTAAAVSDGGEVVSVRGQFRGRGLLAHHRG